MLYRNWKKRPFEGEDPVYLNFYLERQSALKQRASEKRPHDGTT